LTWRPAAPSFRSVENRLQYESRAAALIIHCNSKIERWPETVAYITISVTVLGGVYVTEGRKLFQA
jgi:hypothetical protein